MCGSRVHTDFLPASKEYAEVSTSAAGSSLLEFTGQVPVLMGYLTVIAIVIALFRQRRHPAVVTVLVVVLVFVMVFVTMGMPPYTAVAVALAAGLAAARICRRAES